MPASQIGYQSRSATAATSRRPPVVDEHEVEVAARRRLARGRSRPR